MRLYTTPRFAPLPDTQRINWPSVADELHARPGEWAAVGMQDCGRHPLNRDKLGALGLECTSRSNGDGTWTIWMRGVEGWAPERVEPTKAPVELVPVESSRLGKIPCTYGTGLGLHWARWYVYERSGIEALGACCDEHRPERARRDADACQLAGLPESMANLPDVEFVWPTPLAPATYKWFRGERRTVAAAA